MTAPTKPHRATNTKRCCASSGNFWRSRTLKLEEVSERSERALRKTRILAMDLAKWLQTATSTTKLTPSSLGAGGPVCPFVPKSLKMNSIYFSVVRTSALVQDSITEELEVRLREILIKLTKDFIPIFQNLEPNTGKLRQFKAVILCFPDVLDAQAHSIIDAVQVAVKPFFVSKGLMVGEFHKNNNNSGLRNPNFFPLRTPFPCLALRHMVPGDVEFMNLDEYDDSMCISLLNGFLDVFGADEEKEQVIKAKRLLENLLKKNT